MVTWGIMFVINLIISITIISFGAWLLKKPPKDINSVLGYRSKRSMRSKETWSFGNKTCGSIWTKIGVVTCVVSTITMIGLRNMNLESADYGIWGIGLCIFQGIMIAYSIIYVEKRLKKVYDEQGKKRLVD